MMGDNRIGHNGRHPFDAGPNSRIDLFLRSESPRVQQFILHQKLKEEIEKNSSERARYEVSELYMRNNERSQTSGTSEVQSATLNIGIASHSKQSSRLPATPSSSTPKREVGRNFNLGGTDSEESNQRPRQQETVNRICQVCLIKEVRQNLMNVNKMVQERNEEISKLKAKCLRSYFERQMME